MPHNFDSIIVTNAESAGALNLKVEIKPAHAIPFGNNPKTSGLHLAAFLLEYVPIPEFLDELADFLTHRCRLCAGLGYIFDEDHPRGSISAFEWATDCKACDATGYIQPTAKTRALSGVAALEEYFSNLPE